MNSPSTNKGVCVLILEGDRAAAETVANLLPREFTQRIVLAVDEAEAFLGDHAADLLICADDLQEESGLMFLARTRTKWPAMKRILMVPDPDGDLFFDALREVPGLFFLRKPLEKRAFQRMIHHALRELSADLADDAQNPSLPFQPSAGQMLSAEDAPLITSTMVLILETDPLAASRIPTLLPWGFRHRIVSTVGEAETLLDAQPVVFFLCADDLQEESGLMFLARTRDKWPATKRILMVPDPEEEFFFHAAQGLPRFLYLRKPVSKPELLHVLRHGLHDAVFDEEGEVPSEEEPSALSRGILSLATGTFAILIAAVFVFAIIYLTHPNSGCIIYLNEW